MQKTGARSMTGYGSGKFELGEDGYRVEIRSVNGRHLDVKLRLPNELNATEPHARALLRERVSRGSLLVSITSLTGHSTATEFVVDLPLARRVRDALDEVRGTLGLSGSLTLDHILQAANVVTTVQHGVPAEAAWKALKKGLTDALDDLDGMRHAEGEQLADDIRGRMNALETIVGKIEAALPASLAGQRARITRRLAELTADLDGKWHEGRLEAELALLAERSDIAEELTRARAHVTAVRKLVDDIADTPRGRKLEFLAIELNREFNTTASKSVSSEISALTIEAKAEIERVREQVANIE